MIYDMVQGWIFVHIPRTAGQAITTAVARYARTARIDAVERRHARACDLVRTEPFTYAWSRLDKFAVIRDPWSIIRSVYALVVAEASALQSDSAAWLVPDWYETLLRQRAEPGFDAFVRREYLTHNWSGGFWPHFCHAADGSDLGFDAIRYADLDAIWPDLVRRMGLPGGTTLERVNGRPYPADAVWSRDLIDAVGVVFHADVVRFKFEPPSTG